MCCEHKSHHHGGHCACGGKSRIGPAFWTKKEKIAWLEGYLENLEEETKTIQKRITALKEGE
ncbi:MAG: hypothetical protein PVF74_13005 [Anaerolineales bacterium]|jgi:hypothetical protein